MIKKKMYIFYRTKKIKNENRILKKYKFNIKKKN